MTKGIIYYTDSSAPEPILTVVQKYILASHLPIVSVSQKPINMPNNVVLPLQRGVISMWRQIETALRHLDTKYVFFCEHDVLYPKCHFDFTPNRDDIFFYNANTIRWKWNTNTGISYDRLISLSGLCTNRTLALKHYQDRLKRVQKEKLTDNSKEPSWARKWGYEPGTKKKKRGGFSDDDFLTWHSPYPTIDIRHKYTFSPPKVTLESFVHKPKNWKEISINDIPGWNLKNIFNIKQNTNYYT